MAKKSSAGGGGARRVKAVDGPMKKSPARKALGDSATPKNKPSFKKGKRTAKRSGTS